MVRVVLDSDFLSSFLKIGQLHRVREYFGVENLYLPSAVFREVSVTRLLPRLTEIPWLEVQEVTDDMVDGVALEKAPEFSRLGKGEHLSTPSTLRARHPVYSSKLFE